MTTLSILSGGAAQGLVRALEADFTRGSGVRLDATFGAVGAMRARLAAGHPTDVVILTAAVLAALVGEGVVRAGTLTDLGGVETAIAVREGERAPAVADAAGLTAALSGAGAIYFPDPEQATAGIHFARVIEKLGLAERLRGRLRAFPNGATAMAALAQAAEPNPIGCTQVTEILATPGVTLVAPLPPGCDLTTLYTAGVVTASANPEAARALLAHLGAERHAEMRARCGFV